MCISNSLSFASLASFRSFFADSGPERIRLWGLQSHVEEHPRTAWSGTLGACFAAVALCFPLLLGAPSCRLHIENSKQTSQTSHTTCISLTLGIGFLRIQQEIRGRTSQRLLHLLIYIKYISSCLLSVSLEGERSFFLSKAKRLSCMLNPLSNNILLLGILRLVLSILHEYVHVFLV